MSHSTCPENAAEAARHIRGATIAWGPGDYIDLDDPDNVRVSLDDYAYCLAYTPRWRGQCRMADGRRPFYGVLQHCVFGTKRMLEAGLPREVAIAFLFHESDEVPFGDFPGPSKRIPAVKEVTVLAGRIGASIDRGFGITDPDPDLVKRWDIRMLVTEKRDLLSGKFGADQWHNGGNGGQTSSEGFEPFEERIWPYSNPEDAVAEFFDLCHQLELTDTFGNLRSE
jgi:hypothetical protein